MVQSTYAYSSPYKLDTQKAGENVNAPFLQHARALQYACMLTLRCTVLLAVSVTGSVAELKHCRPALGMSNTDTP